MLTSLALAILPTLAQAGPVRSTTNERRWLKHATCRDFYADITAQSNNTDLISVIGQAPANQQAYVQSQIEQFAAGSTVMQDIMNAPSTNVSGTYSLWFELCEPTSGNATGIFQAHHGLVGNAGYWNVDVGDGERYSFADAAAQAGWATLSYDRLGVGRSAHPDGISTVQISYEIAQSIEIGSRLRAGTLDSVGQWNTIVGIGHSYGSLMMTGVAALSPETFDMLVLTGFTANSTNGPLGLAGFGATIASVAYPERFGELSNSYVITGTPSNDQIGFFHYPNYTQTAFDFFTKNKGEYTIGQSLTIAGPTTLSRQAYNRPVFVVTGHEDAPFCAGNCSVTSLTGANATQLDTSKTLFPSVPDNAFGTYVVPATGHAINYHLSAYGAYQQIFNFIREQKQ